MSLGKWLTGYTPLGHLVFHMGIKQAIAAGVQRNRLIGQQKKEK